MFTPWWGGLHVPGCMCPPGEEGQCCMLLAPRLPSMRGGLVAQFHSLRMLTLLVRRAACCVFALLVRRVAWLCDYPPGEEGCLL